MDIIGNIIGCILLSILLIIAICTSDYSLPPNPDKEKWKRH